MQVHVRSFGFDWSRGLARAPTVYTSLPAAVLVGDTFKLALPLPVPARAPFLARLGVLACEAVFPSPAPCLACAVQIKVVSTVSTVRWLNNMEWTQAGPATNRCAASDHLPPADALCLLPVPTR